jgi:hypothetical protein
MVGDQRGSLASLPLDSNLVKPSKQTRGPDLQKSQIVL